MPASVVTPGSGRPRRSSLGRRLLDLRVALVDGDAVLAEKVAQDAIAIHQGDAEIEETTTE
jgi:hypothetical protein